jgi:hypothetical protein
LSNAVGVVAFVFTGYHLFEVFRDFPEEHFNKEEH